MLNAVRISACRISFCRTATGFRRHPTMSGNCGGASTFLVFRFPNAPRPAETSATPKDRRLASDRSERNAQKSNPFRQQTQSSVSRHSDREYSLHYLGVVPTHGVIHLGVSLVFTSAAGYSRTRTESSGAPLPCSLGYLRPLPRAKAVRYFWIPTSLRLR